MTIAIVSTEIDRKTGKKRDEKIIECEKNIDEDEIYNPLVKILYNHFYKDWKDSLFEGVRQNDTA